jgi:hypothetical protein
MKIKQVQITYQIILSVIVSISAFVLLSTYIFRIIYKMYY